MTRRDPERNKKIKAVLLSLVARGVNLHQRRYYGSKKSTNYVQSRLAEYYGVSRQRVHQIVRELGI